MPKTDNLQGALELLVLKILRQGPNHGFFIATSIQQMSDAVLRVEAGSLYPALHRMTEAGLLKPEWRVSDAGRRARFYEVTPKGLRKLDAEEKKVARDFRGGREDSPYGLSVAPGGVIWDGWADWRKRCEASGMPLRSMRSFSAISPWIWQMAASGAMRG